MKKFFSALILLWLLGMAGYGAWKASLRPSASATTAEPEMVATAEIRDINFNIQLTGDITPYFQVDIKPEVSGKIKKLYTITGQVVRKGDMIAEVDDSDLQTERASVLTEIEGARLRVEKNRKNFERAKDLMSAKLITQEVFDNLGADYAISENDLDKSERRLQIVDDKITKTKVKAPADGTILATKVIEGQVVVAAASVNSGTTLMTLADLNKLRIDSHVNQVDIGKIKVGQRLTFQCRAVGATKSSAEITFIEPMASTKNNVKGFKIEALIEDADPRLRSGLTVSMTLPIASAANCVSVPVSAVFKDGEEETNIVYVKNGDLTEKRSVEVGVTDLFYAQITSGLASGEKILLIEPKS